MPAHRCCSRAGTGAALPRQGRAALRGGSEEEEEEGLIQGLALITDLTDMGLGFSHEKVLRSLQLVGSVGTPSH